MRPALRPCVSILALACLSASLRAAPPGAPADPAKRDHDEIVIGGEWFHTGGTTVILWTDPDGRDLTAYQRRPVTRPASQPTSQPTTGPATEPASQPTTEASFRTIRGPEVPLAELKQSINQFVIHFDACGTSLECFNVLKRRGLAVQFMLDLDGTIYQTMDAGQAAAHATIANSRSVGVEVANIGGYEVPGPVPPGFKIWYRKDNGSTRIVVPADRGDGGIHTPNFVGRPARSDLVEGIVQGKTERQYDFTPQQYRALARLTATLCTVLPEIKPDYPRQTSKLGLPHPEATTQPTPGDPTTQPAALAAFGQPGLLIPHALTPEQYDAWHGVLGHYHVQLNKDDPGPAFQWVPLMTEVRRLMNESGSTSHRP